MNQNAKTHLALGALLCVGLPVVLLARPHLEQLVATSELCALHVRVPRRVARETPVQTTLCARHHQTVAVRGREDAGVNGKHVAAPWTRAAQRVTVGIQEELRVPGLVRAAEPREDLIAVHQGAARRANTLNLHTDKSVPVRKVMTIILPFTIICGGVC